MEAVTLSTLANWANGELLRGDPARTVTNVCTDSRTLKPDDLFIALRGEKFDAHDFVAQAAEQGAAGAVVDSRWLEGGAPSLGASEKARHSERSEESRKQRSAQISESSIERSLERSFACAQGDNACLNGATQTSHDSLLNELPENFALIRVKDTLAALQNIASNYRRTLPLKVVAITGSNGKTSTKDFTAAVLGEKFRVTKTQGNLNNHIGLPLTMLRANASDEFGVWEIGMNHPGEIEPLARLAQPDVAVITSIGVAHIEFMGSRDAIAQEKGMLAEAVGASGHVVLPAEDDYADSIAKRTKARVILAGLERGEIRATNVVTAPDGSRFTLQNARGETAGARIAVPGQHMVRNALLAVAVGVIFGLSLEECAAGLTKVQLTKGRLEQKLIRGIRILDDTYNANPDSVVAALRTLAQMPGRHIAVLGEMKELGAESARGHRQVGEATAHEKIDCVVTVGSVAAQIAETARQHGVKQAFTAGSTAEAAALLREVAREGDTVLIKGSRSARMETIVEELAKA